MRSLPKQPPARRSISSQRRCSRKAERKNSNAAAAAYQAITTAVAFAIVPELQRPATARRLRLLTTAGYDAGALTACGGVAIAGLRRLQPAPRQVRFCAARCQPGPRLKIANRPLDDGGH